ncbi:hypothetical protein FACS189487_06620 [Campylobacterota bacterium]|nr:hypothetical protein FACS189487_06620 [Campylobacterota bacterium]
MTDIEQSIKSCIAALNGNAPNDSGKFVCETLRKMYETPYNGRGLGIGSHRTGRIMWGDRREWIFFKEELGSSLDFLHVLLCLFDGANLSEKEMLDYAEQIQHDNIIYNHILEHILENLAEQNAIEEIKRYIPYFRSGNVYADNGNDIIDQESQEYFGWRIIARYYAKKADTDNFFKIFKLCEPSKDKYDMELIKIALARSVMLIYGIDAAIKLLSHKNIGDRYAINILSVLADKGEYEKLKAIFAKYPQLKQLEKETELNILSAAYESAAKQGFILDDAEFNALFDRALAVNTKLKCGDSKLRDTILFNLGLASKNNNERCTRCRKAIKNNWIKKELSNLT